MQFRNAFIPAPLLWSSPFIRWQGSTADVSSLDLAVQVTRDALQQRQFDAHTEVDQLVFGSTIPQANSFYAAPWVAARLGLEQVGGPLVSQACATAVASLATAASATCLSDNSTQLVITADRTSNGPLLVYPRSAAMGGSPSTEHWVLQSFSADPWTGHSMVHTAEATARDGGFTRAQCDELTLLRHSQYQMALQDDGAALKPYLQPIVIEQRKSRLVLSQDEGVADYSAKGLAGLRPTLPKGVITSGSQTHPADGSAGAVVTHGDNARRLSAGQGVVQILSVGFARAEKGRMPKAPALAAEKALHAAGLNIGQLKTVTTHNPFAVNDLWFSQATGFALEKMNPLGCSLIYGHPQAPTGMRAIAELVHALRAQGGGLGLFAGCAAGDMGAALVLRLDD